MIQKKAINSAKMPTKSEIEVGFHYFSPTAGTYF